MRPETFDVTIVGAGAAGFNAALILGRARRTVLLCDDERQRNEVAEHMHGFLSRDGFAPQEGCRVEKRDGVYAAGDCVTHRHQVIIAAASGVRAAISINEDLLQDDLTTLSAAKPTARAVTERR